MFLWVEIKNNMLSCAVIILEDLIVYFVDRKMIFHSKIATIFSVSFLFNFE
jgi:hypothetical protein